MFRIRFKEDDELVFTCRAWLKAFKVKEDVYNEWSLEFFSTLWVDEKIKVENNTNEDEINKPSFGIYLKVGEMNFDKFPIRRAANVPWIITMNLFNRAAEKRVTSKIGGGQWVTRIVKNLRLFVPLDIKKCSPPLKLGWLDKKAFIGLIDKETNALLPPDEDDEEDKDEQEIEHEENVEQEEQVERETLVQQRDGFEEMSRRMSEVYGMVSRLTYQMDYFEPILTHYAQAHNLTMTHPYNLPGVSGSLGHGNDNVGAGCSIFTTPSQVAKLVEYDDGMDEDNDYV
ncbi:hypothetical protein Tco_0359784 [Tanacetum coccineum]